jgi:hypothetical protein
LARWKNVAAVHREADGTVCRIGMLEAIIANAILPSRDTLRPSFAKSFAPKK